MVPVHLLLKTVSGQTALHLCLWWVAYMMIKRQKKVRRSHSGAAPYTMTRVWEELRTMVSEAELKRAFLSWRRQDPRKSQTYSGNWRAILQKRRNMLVGWLGQLQVHKGIHQILMYLSVLFRRIHQFIWGGHDSVPQVIECLLCSRHHVSIVYP